jgi:hypothetical protein
MEPVRAGATVGESQAPPVSWGAVLAGAFVAAAMTLFLVILGAGLGLASVSPWSADNPPAGTLSHIAAAWIVVSHIIAAALGGYITGRLRTRWRDTRTDEIFFRDTAHGFLVWSVGAVIGAVAFTHAAGAIVAGTTRAATVGGAIAAVARGEDRSTYFVDMLFRSENDNAAAAQPPPTAEVSRILAVSLAAGAMTAADKARLAHLIATRTGLIQTEAERRIDEVINQAKEAANTARKAAAALAAWLAISLLAGAFTATYFATVGGRIRDRH